MFREEPLDTDAVGWVSPASLLFDDNCDCAISHLLGLRQSNITQYSINPASMTIAFTAKRQTLLFSATQTRNVEDLARVSLKKEPLYIGVDDNKVREILPVPLPGGGMFKRSSAAFFAFFCTFSVGTHTLWA